MLLKLIKIRSYTSGMVCELREKNPILGDKLLAEVLIVHDEIPLELIYRLSVSYSGICLNGIPTKWKWGSNRMEVVVTNYLLGIQRTREEIRIDVCQPVPDLPGYPEVDYHPQDIYECELAVGLEEALDIPDE